ncbi:MAG: restriction endonuclease [Spirochaetales bacterium]|nr:restriction endonuclease [Spirochaetales bacterium]
MNAPNAPRNILVRKASGEEESFEPEKLLQSLRSAGADDAMANEILADIEKWLTNGTPTRKIYARALSLLGHRTKSAAGRYRIKDALMELGNSGRPFEIFVGEIFKAKGYEVETGIVVQGKSITHEMDVIATGHGRQHLVECKYSQMQGNHVSIQVPLYVHSRINDIVALRQSLNEYRNLRFTGWIATNTRFSTDSIQYSSDYSLELLSWDYPRGESLRNIIERDRIFPVTILSTLNPKEKVSLIARDIVTCGQLAANRGVLKDMGISGKKETILLDELGMIETGR